MKRILSICLLFLVQSNLFAQWVQTSGPSGGGVSDFAFVNGKILAATFDIGNGVYSSTDNGSSWHEAGLQGEMLTHITANHDLATDTYTVLTSTTQNSYNETDTIYRSVDGGVTWNVVLTIPNIDAVSTICYFNHQWIISTEGQSGGMFSSTNDGVSWDSFQPAIIAFSSPVILVPVNSFLLAGTNKDGHIAVYSSPEGRTFTITAGIDPSLTSEIYCGTVSGNTIMFGVVGGIIYSKDGGVSWTQPSSPDLKDKAEYIAHIAGTGNDIIAVSSMNKVFISHNGGQTWDPVVGNGLPVNASYLFSVGFDADAQMVYLGASSGILRQSFFGNSWNYSTEGVRAASISELSENNGKLFAATERGVSFSSDAGSSWHDPQNLSDLEDVPITGFLNGASTFYAYGSGLYIWNGSNWNTIDTDQITAFAEGSSGRLFAAKQTGDAISGTGEIDISDNSGGQWNPALTFANSFDTEFYIMPKCIATNGNGVIVAVQRAVVFFSFSSIYTVYRSTDNGNNWEVMATVNSPAFLYYADNEFYLGTYGHGLYISADNGSTWGQSNLAQGIDVISLIKVTGSLLISVNGNGNAFDGLYYSNNDGTSWNYANYGTANIFGSLTSDGSYLFSGGPSVWRRPLQGLAVHDTKPVLQDISLEFYPNPAANIIHTHIDASHPVEGSMLIYDEKGVVVLKQDVSVENSEEDLSLSVAGLSDGAYYAKLMDKNGNIAATSRFIIGKK